MTILKLEIKGFGKLSDLDISLGKGFNVVYGGNEAGKSTLQMYIKAMLYGLKGGRANSESVLPPLGKYRPWSSKAYGGAMEYMLDNGDMYRVERDFDRGTALVFDQNFNDISSSFKSQRDKVPLFAQKHLGMDEACFERTVFVRQLETRLDASGSLELKNRLSNIAQTGFEDISYGRAEKALREALKACSGSVRAAGRGADSLEQRLKCLAEERVRACEKRDRFLSNEKRLKELEEARDRLLKEKEYLEDVGKVIAVKRRLEEKKRILASLEETAAELKEARSRILNLETGLKDEGLKKPGHWIRRATAFAIAAAITAVIYYISGRFPFGGESHLFWRLSISAAVFIITGAVLLYLQKAPAALGDNVPSRIGKNGGEEGGSETKGDNIKTEEAAGSMGSAHAEIAMVSEEVEDLESRLKSGIGHLVSKYSSSGLKVDFFGPDTISQVIQEGNPDWIDDSFGYVMDNINEQLMSTALDVKECQTISGSLGEDGGLLQSIDEEMQALEEEKKELKRKGTALQLALNVLNEAAAELVKEFSPGLNVRMGETAAEITSGRYLEIKADERLRPMVIVPEESEVKDANLLSGGTIEQIYLSLRIAAAEILTRGKENLPLIFDEAFSQYDDERVLNTLRFFRNNMTGGQVILFTCKKRELELAREVFGNSAVFHILE